jgi:hypothetical protein
MRMFKGTDNKNNHREISCLSPGIRDDQSQGTEQSQNLQIEHRRLESVVSNLSEGNALEKDVHMTRNSRWIMLSLRLYLGRPEGTLETIVTSVILSRPKQDAQNPS